MKYWEIIADNLKKAGWSYGYVSAIDSNGRTIWIADAHRGDGKRFVASFILDIAWQRAYERSCRQVTPYVPAAQEEIERKIGQSLPRSGLIKLVT